MGYRDRIILKIKHELQKEKINQKEFANRLGISEVTLSRLLNGRRKVSLAMAVKIANYFNVRLDVLIGREPNIKPIPVVIGHPTTTLSSIANGACYCPRCQYTFYRQEVGMVTSLIGQSYKQYCSKCGTLLSVPFIS